MKISSKSWKSYIDRLSKIDKKAADTVANFYRENPGISVEQLIGYCLSVADYYGNAAGELACEMYEEVAIASGKTIPTPEPARTATYGEMASAIRGTLLQSQNPDAIGAVVGRKVKTVSLDTILKNSLRDGAYFAWIPSGDTCAFCIMLASNGWQRASKKALRKGHASHVHNNCDCTYAVRFDDSTEVEGYDDGKAYKAMYDLEGIDPKIIKKYEKEHGPIRSYKDRLNIMRQAQYTSNPEKYRAQKRIAYMKRKTLANSGNNDIIMAGGKGLANSVKRLKDPVERSKIIREANLAKQAIYAEDLRFAYNTYGVKKDGDLYDVVLHGSSLNTEYEHKYLIDTETLAYMISGRKDYMGHDIRLLSCDTGRLDQNGNCVAQELANILNVRVKAPIDTLIINPDGKLTVGVNDLSEKDGFRWFDPKL